MACRAVISAPERSAASTTITPSDMPLMMRFRWGKVPASGDERGGCSLIKAPVGRDQVGQLVVLGRIDVHHAAGQDAERAAAGLQRAAMGGRVDPAGQAADDRQSGPGKAGRQPFGLPQPVGRAVPRADDADAQGVGRFERAADEEQARRIGDLAQGAGILGVGLGEDGDAVAAAQGDLGFGVDLVAGADDPLGQFRPHAFHLAQLARRRGQHRRRIAEAVQQSAANPRPHAIDQGKTHRIDQIGIVVGHGGGQRR